MLAMPVIRHEQLKKISSRLTHDMTDITISVVHAQNNCSTKAEAGMGS